LVSANYLYVIRTAISFYVRISPVQGDRLSKNAYAVHVSGNTATIDDTEDNTKAHEASNIALKRKR